MQKRMPKRSRTEDPNESAHRTAQEIIARHDPEAPRPRSRAKRKNPAAVALGRKGGKKGGPARAAAMTPRERRESAQRAALARWGKPKSTPDET